MWEQRGTQSASGLYRAAEERALGRSTCGWLRNRQIDYIPVHRVRNHVALGIHETCAKASTGERRRRGPVIRTCLIFRACVDHQLLLLVLANY